MVTVSNSMSVSQAAGYFEKDNYYIKDGVAEKGQWFGETAARLDLKGEVNMKDFYALAHGINPKSLNEQTFQTLKTLDKTESVLRGEFSSIEKMKDGELKEVRLSAYIKNTEQFNNLRQELNKGLGENKFVRDTKDEKTGILTHGRAGFDMTFSAPKSVSIMALVARDDRLIEAHREAMNKTMAYVQEHFAETREYTGGEGETKTREHVTTSNIASAQFTHYTSRSAEGQTPDPQLHTHNFIFNITDSDGTMRSLSNEEILRATKLAGQFYQNALASATEKLGYATEWQKTGGNYTFEIKGMQKELIDNFSKRDIQIEAHLKNKELELGRALTSAEIQVIKLETRTAKEEQNMNELHKDWDRQSSNMGYTKEDLFTITKDQANDKTIAIDAKEAITKAVYSLQTQKSVFTGHEILHEASKVIQGKATLEELQEALILNTKNRAGLENQTDTYELAASKFNTHTLLYSSKEVLDAEGYIKRIIIEGKNTGQIVSLKEFTKIAQKTDQHFKVLAESKGDTHYSLTDGQARAMELIATSNDRVVGIQGDAGTGKTTMLKHLNHAVGDNVEFIGLAFTGKAASEIENASGIKSQTLDHFLLKTPEKNEKQKVLIIDESSMVGTLKMQKVIEKAEELDAKIVLIGDAKQLKAVDQGDMFLKLQNDKTMTTVEMNEVLRQKTDLTKEVVEAFKSPNTLIEGILKLQEAGKVIEAKEVLEVPRQQEIYGSAPLEEEVRKRVFYDMTKVREAFVENVANDYTKKGLNSTLALVNTNQERAEFNQAIKAALQAQGVVSNTGRIIETHENKNLSTTDAQFARNYDQGDILVSSKHQGDIKSGNVVKVIETDQNTNKIKIAFTNAAGDEKEKWIDANSGSNFSAYTIKEREFSVGDKISFEKNEYKKFNVRNGETAIIREIKDDKFTVYKQSGEKIVLDTSLYPNLSHAYAMTVHKSQGQSVDHVHAYSDSKSGLNNHAVGYVQTSRAQESITIYTDNAKDLVAKYKEKVTKENASDYIIMQGFDSKSKQQDPNELMQKAAFPDQQLNDTSEKNTEQAEVPKELKENSEHKISSQEEYELKKSVFEQLREEKYNQKIILTAEIKSMDPGVVLDALGLNYKELRGGTMYQFAVREERTASANMFLDNKSGTWKYKDFGGNGGDVFTLVQDVMRVDFKEAQQFVADRLGIQGFDKIDATVLEERLAQAKERMSQNTTKAREFSITSRVISVEKINTAERQTDSFLRSRGFDSKPLPDWFVKINGEYDKKSPSGENITKKQYGFGVMFDNGKGGDIHFAKPVTLKDGKVLKTQTFGEKGITTIDSGKEKIAIFESKNDAVAAFQQGLTKDSTIIIANGTGLAHEVVNHIKENPYKEVTFFNQNDSAGEKFVEKIATEAKIARFKFVQYSGEKGQDINDLHKAGVKISERFNEGTLEDYKPKEPAQDPKLNFENTGPIKERLNQIAKDYKPVIQKEQDFSRVR